MLVSGMLRPVADSAEMVGLGAFLRTRCGSLKAAFQSLDTNGLGHLTSETFVTGVRALGYKEDAERIFRSLDTEHTGLITLRAFLITFGNEGNDENDNKSVRSMMTTHSGSGSTKERVSIGAQFSSTPSTSTSPGPGPTYGPDISERMARLEEQLASERTLRREAEKRFAQRVNNLVGGTIAEQADKLREMIVLETSERKTECSLMQSNMEALRSNPVGINLDSRLEVLSKQIESRMQAIEQKVNKHDRLLEVHSGSPQGELTQGKVEALLLKVEAMEAAETEWRNEAASLRLSATNQQSNLEAAIEVRLQTFTRDTLGELKSALSATEDAATLAAETAAGAIQNCTRLDSRVSDALATMGAAPSCSREEIEKLFNPQFQALREDWRSAIEDERTRGSDRDQTLLQSLRKDFESSTVAQAIAEARAEAKAAVAQEIGVWRSDHAEQISGLKERFSLLDTIKQTDDSDHRFLELSKSVSRLEGSVNGSIARNEEQLTEMNASQAESQQELSALKAQISSIKKAITIRPDGTEGGLPLLEVEDLKVRVDSLAKDVQERDAHMQDLTNKIQERVQSLIGKVDCAIEDGLTPKVPQLDASSVSNRGAPPPSSTTGRAASPCSVRVGRPHPSINFTAGGSATLPCGQPGGSVRLPGASEGIASRVKSPQRSTESSVPCFSPAPLMQDRGISLERKVLDEGERGGYTQGDGFCRSPTIAGRPLQPARTIDNSTQSQRSVGSAGARQSAHQGIIDISTQSTKSIGNAGAKAYALPGSLDSLTQPANSGNAIHPGNVDNSAKFGAASVYSDGKSVRSNEQPPSSQGEPEVLNAIKALREEVLRLHEQQDKEEKHLKGQVANQPPAGPVVTQPPSAYMSPRVDLEEVPPTLEQKQMFISGSPPTLSALGSVTPVDGMATPAKSRPQGSIGRGRPGIDSSQSSQSSQIAARNGPLLAGRGGGASSSSPPPQTTVPQNSARALQPVSSFTGPPSSQPMVGAGRGRGGLQGVLQAQSMRPLPSTTNPVSGGSVSLPRHQQPAMPTSFARPSY